MAKIGVQKGVTFKLNFGPLSVWTVPGLEKPVFAMVRMVGVAGIEPATPAMSKQRSGRSTASRSDFSVIRGAPDAAFWHALSARGSLRSTGPCPCGLPLRLAAPNPCLRREGAARQNAGNARFSRPSEFRLAPFRPHFARVVGNLHRKRTGLNFEGE